MLSSNIPSRLCLLSLLFSTAFAAPYNGPGEEEGLAIRATAGSSKSDPIDATFNIAGWEDIAEENCYAMLCLYGGERVWQRSPTDLGDTNYEKSGASLTPFQKNKLAEFGTKQIDSDSGDETETRSAEEFPWRSMAKGGSGSMLFPATIAQQRSQGGSITGGYRRKPKIGYNKWFKITFNGNFGTMCTALMKDPPDTSVCTNPSLTLFGKTGINIANYVWTAVLSGGVFVFQHAAGTYKGKVGKRMSLIEMRAMEAEGYKFVKTRAEEIAEDEFIPLEMGNLQMEGHSSLETRAEGYDNEDWDLVEFGAEEFKDEESSPI